MFLHGFATSDEVWPSFDGWCASRGVDHWVLPWSRWLNLVYHFAVRDADKEGREKFDKAMADYVAQAALDESKPDIKRAVDTSATTGRRKGLPPKPAGWGTPEQVTMENMAAFKTLTAGSVSGKRR